MSLRKLPEIKADARMGVSFDLRPDALDRWTPEVKAAEGDDTATISIYDVIGADIWGEGVTAKRIAGALRSIGKKDVTVNVNSPGGDFFEGVAIYNLLREHPAKVTIKVMGLAASAASVIAMAGDEVLIGDGAFLMIHNAWALAVGNRHDMRATADQLEPFDAAMADVYAARTGLERDEVARMMDKETWLSSSQAIEDGFADGLVDRAEVITDESKAGSKKALALVEAAMAKAGHSRSTRRETLKALFSGKPGAAGPTTPCAGDDADVLRRLTDTINSLRS